MALWFLTYLSVVAAFSMPAASKHAALMRRENKSDASSAQRQGFHHVVMDHHTQSARIGRHATMDGETTDTSSQNLLLVKMKEWLQEMRSLKGEVASVAEEVKQDDGKGEIDFHVDIVYAWMEQPSEEDYEEIYDTCGHTSGSDNRYRDTGTLKFSLLSVQMYLPWVRKVFLLSSNGARPSWISELSSSMQSKVVLVSHAQIWPKEKHLSELPTHNSQAIEAHVHQVPGLAEHFLYLNDDLFIGRELPKSEFFNKDGSTVTLVTKEIRISEVDLTSVEGITPAAVSIAPPYRKSAMEALHHPTSRQHCTTLQEVSIAELLHQAQPYRKSAMEALVATFKPQFDAISGERCRTSLAFAPFWFLLNYQFVKGMGVTRLVTGDIGDLGAFLSGRNVAEDEEWYRTQLTVRPNRFCINDDFSQDKDIYSHQMSRLHAFLNEYFKTFAMSDVHASAGRD